MGDELIAAGQARRAFAKDPSRRVEIVDALGHRRTHALWTDVPYIVLPSEKDRGNLQRVSNYPGHRPYIHMKTASKWWWLDFECTPAEIVFSEPERIVSMYYAGRVILEPSIKGKASPNKAWGWSRWEELAARLIARGLPVAQMGPPKDPPRLLPGVEWIKTTDFRYAAAVLSTARGAVLPEGGLHHAAAAVDAPAVVIFGGFISPRQTGYKGQVAMYDARVGPCGSREPGCKHCEKIMSAITPERVEAELLKILR